MVPKTVDVVYQKETVELLFCVDVSCVICTSRHGNFRYWLITFSVLEQLPKTITKNNSSKSPYIEENSHMILVNWHVYEHEYQFMIDKILSISSVLF